MGLIDRDALRTNIETNRDASDMPKMWYEGIEYAINHIIHAPTIDAVQVVRCKDCKWYEGKWGCSHLDMVRTDMDDWFCADGERK